MEGGGRASELIDQQPADGAVQVLRGKARRVFLVDPETAFENMQKRPADGTASCAGLAANSLSICLRAANQQLCTRAVH